MAIYNSSLSTNTSSHLFDHSYLMATASRPKPVFCRGKGDFLFDTSNTRYLDFVQGWAVNCLGHSPAVLVKTISGQAENLWNPSPAYYNKPLLELAHALTKACGMDQVYFSNSGAEANEGAIKLARKWAQLNKPGATQIITTHGAFHGRTLATMSASGKASFEPLFNPKVDGFLKVPFNDINAMKDAISKDVIAVMLEPIQGEAGVIPAEDNYLKMVESLCKENNVLLILDEIQTGMGRVGHLLAAQSYGVKADIITLGKGLGGGAPLSALLANNAICCFQPGDQGGTFGGNPLLAAVGFTVLAEIVQPEFLSHVNEMSAYLKCELELLFGEGSVRGRGLLLAVDIPVGNANDIVIKALEKHLLINAPNEHCLRFMPALNVSTSSIEMLISILRDIQR